MTKFTFWELHAKTCFHQTFPTWTAQQHQLPPTLEFSLISAVHLPSTCTIKRPCCISKNSRCCWVSPAKRHLTTRLLLSRNLLVCPRIILTAWGNLSPWSIPYICWRSGSRWNWSSACRRISSQCSGTTLHSNQSIYGMFHVVSASLENFPDDIGILRRKHIHQINQILIGRCCRTGWRGSFNRPWCSWCRWSWSRSFNCWGCWRSGSRWSWRPNRRGSRQRLLRWTRL